MERLLLLAIQLGMLLLIHQHIFHVLGGVVAYIASSGTVTGCYNQGSVYASNSSSSHHAAAGGVLGALNVGTLSKCYNTGYISAYSSSFQSEIGGVVGGLYNGTISYCYNSGTVEDTSSRYAHVGGIVGDVDDGKVDNTDSGSETISNCFNEGTVSATNTSSGSAQVAGGIVANLVEGIVTNCYNLGSVSATAGTYNAYSGGIAGWIYSKGIVRNCYNQGAVSGTNSSTRYYVATGGIVGIITSGTIINCYNTGEISASSGRATYAYLGGIAGRNQASDNGISLAYWLETTATTGVYSNAGTATTTSMTDTEMQDESFVTTLNSNISSITSDVDLLEWVQTTTYPTFEEELGFTLTIEVNSITITENIITATATITSITIEDTLKATINVIVEKLWEDSDNKAGVRPDTITVELVASTDSDENYDISANAGTTIETKVELSEDGNGDWTYTWESLPKYDSTTEEEIDYTVEETEYDGEDISASKYYYLTNTEETTKDGTKTVTITNSRYATITVTVVDKGNSTTKLGGATFKIEKLKDDGTVDDSFTAIEMATSTDEADLGTLTFDTLEYGTYQITQTVAPSGYNLLTGTIETIELSEDDLDITVTIKLLAKYDLPTTGGDGKTQINTGIIGIAIGMFGIFICTRKRKK